MLTHSDIWDAIDALANRNNLSPSGLAKQSGLDPTSFNKSKRSTSAGRLRWPSTESISKALKATDTSLAEFMGLVGQEMMPEIGPEAESEVHSKLKPSDPFPQTVQASLGEIKSTKSRNRSYRPVPQVQQIPLIGFAQAGSGGFFDNGGFPAGHGWDEVAFPVGNRENIYALEVSGESMMPLYRDGDVIIVSPSEQVRKGDRVVVRTHDGEVMAKILKRKTSKLVALQSLNPDHEDREFDMAEIDWIARIVWASQ